MIVVYGKPNCPWCEKAKWLLDKENIEYEYYDLSERPDLKDFVISIGAKTVPQCFENDIHIGGYDELELWISF